MNQLTLEQKTQFALEYETARRLTKVKVWNDFEDDYKQPFDEKLIVIPAHSYVEMTFDDAIRFKLREAPIGYNKINPEKWKTVVKMIRVEFPTKEQVFATMAGENLVIDFNKFYNDFIEATSKVDKKQIVTTKSNESKSGLFCPICNETFETAGKLGWHITHKHKEKVTE